MCWVRSELKHCIQRNEHLFLRLRRGSDRCRAFRREKWFRFRVSPFYICGGQSDHVSEITPSAAVSIMPWSDHVSEIPPSTAVSIMPWRPHNYFHCNIVLMKRTEGRSLRIEEYCTSNIMNQRLDDKFHFFFPTSSVQFWTLYNNSLCCMLSSG